MNSRGGRTQTEILWLKKSKKPWGEGRLRVGGDPFGDTIARDPWDQMIRLMLTVFCCCQFMFVCCFVSMYVCPVFVSQGDDRVRCVTTHRSPSRLETGEPGPGSGVADFTSVRERRKGSSTNLLRPTNTAQCVWWDWGMGRGLYPSHPDRYSLPVTLLPPSDHNFQSTCR